jgi:hypothetical protein
MVEVADRYTELQNNPKEFDPRIKLWLLFTHQ